MSAPRTNIIPNTQNWNFIQRFADEQTELLPLAKNLVQFDGQPYLPLKPQILSFLSGDDNNKIEAWTAYWLSIIQTLGLGYTTSQDNLLHTTALAYYVADADLFPERVRGFYRYWALHFQYPWSQDKHSNWKREKRALQPFICLLDHLVALAELERERGELLWSTTYLTYLEVVYVVMREKNDTIYDVRRNVSIILKNRNNGFDYTALRNQPIGGETLEQQLRSRTKGFFDKTDVLTWDNAHTRVSISSWAQFLKALVYLSFRKPPVPIGLRDEVGRVRMFETAFNRLDPHPDVLQTALNEVENSMPNAPTTLHLPKAVHTHLQSQGLNFDPNFIEAFLLSLKTKPFVILSGISGTGKSILPRTLGRIVGNPVRPIAVAPDWTDNSDMLGYFDMNNKFVPGEFTTLVAKAAQNPQTPYFIVLDEMNLARVEYYFAQVLSILESRRLDPQSGQVVTEDYLFNTAMRERLDAADSADVQQLASLRIGPNVYIIGTVNIDETTHPFSKKVLDRSNVLEVNDVNLMQGIEDDNGPQTTPADVPTVNAFFAGNITRMSELKAHWEHSALPSLKSEDTLKTWVEMLAKFADVLKPHSLHFGFRVRDEVCIYLYHAANLNISGTADADWWHRYFDHQLVQKVLTRLSGEQDQIEPTLVKLFNLCVSDVASHDLNSIVNLTEDDLTKDTATDIRPRYRLAARKIWRMVLEVTKEGRPATSFWTAQG